MKVAIFANGQLANNVAKILAQRDGVDVIGPTPRAERATALKSGADVVVLATTSFLAEVADDIREAVQHGSNVIVSAEEAAYPWAVNPTIGDEIDALARQHGVTVLGAGLNPGFAFDALVVACTGPTAQVHGIKVERIVDLSGFGETVLRRIGVGYAEGDFIAGVAAGEITGHIGFPQSMRVAAAALGKQIERIEPFVSPIIATRPHQATHLSVEPGVTAGFEQRYVAIVNGEPWFESLFTGHLDPGSIDKPTRDEIWIRGEPDLHYLVQPGFNAQSGSSSVIANSLERVIDARPGWVTVAELPPARSWAH